MRQKNVKSDYLTSDIDLTFTTDQWRKLIIKKADGKRLLNHRYLELCVLSHVANELRSKDLYIVGADSYADHREELLPWEMCEAILNEYCKKVNIENTGSGCVKQLKEKLNTKAKDVDTSYPDLTEFTIDKTGNPILHKRGPKKKPSSAVWLEKTLKSRMKERNLIDVLCSSQFYSGWAHELGPISGDDPKIKNPIEKYVLTEVRPRSW